MSDFSIGEAVLTGPDLFRRRPGVLAMWVMFQLLTAVVTEGVLILVAGPALNQITHQTGRGDPARVLSMFVQVLPGYLVVLLLSMATFSVTCAAVNRAILRPDDARLAYLRVGADELRQFALMMIFTVLGFIIYVASAVVGGIAVAALSAAIGPAVGATAPTTMILAIVGLIIAAMALLAIRFSLASAQTFDTGRVNPFGSWALTRGRFWKVLATWLVVFVMSGVVIGAAMLLGGATNMALDSAHHAFTLTPPVDMSSLGAYFTPRVAVRLLLFALAYGVVWPLFMTPFAAVYRRLAPLQSLSGATVAEVFG